MSKSNGKGKAGSRARRDGGKEREWRRIIDEQRRQKKASPPALAPVVLVDELRDASVDGASSSIEIMLGGGTMVRVGPDSTREQLAVVLGVLEQTRC